MKFTIEKTVNEEIEIPTYFERLGLYCKIISKTHFLQVCSNELFEELGLEPSINIGAIRHYLRYNDFTEITKEKFDLEFIKAEKLLNELRNK